MLPQTTLRPEEQAQIEALRAAMVRIMAKQTQGQTELVTAIPNLRFFRREGPTQPNYCMLEPNVSLVVQGAKRALLAEETYTYNINRFLITSLDLPSMMHIVEASPQTPYLGLMLRLDLRVLSEVMLQSGITPPAVPPSERGMFLGETTPILLEGFNRLVSLLEEPAAIAVMAPLIEREIYYRLLTSAQCARLWQIPAVGSQSHRIARRGLAQDSFFRAAACGSTGHSGTDEPLHIPPALSQSDLDEPAAIPEMAAPERSAQADAV